MTKQLCSPVKWFDSIQKMVDEGIEIFAEVGPGRVLAGLVKKILPVDHPAEILTVNNMKTLEKNHFFAMDTSSALSQSAID